MMYKTHMASNAAVLLALTNFTEIHPLSINALLVVGGSVVGTLVPDIDNPFSKINYILRFKRIANTNSAPAYNHRESLPHWPFLAFTVLFGLYLNPDFLPPYVTIGVAIGVITHLIVDMFNSYGVLLFAPFSRTRFRLANILVGSKAEQNFFRICIVVCILLFFRLLLR